MCCLLSKRYRSLGTRYVVEGLSTSILITERHQLHLFAQHPFQGYFTMDEFINGMKSMGATDMKTLSQKLRSQTNQVSY